MLPKLDIAEVVVAVAKLGASDGNGESVEVSDVDKSELSKLEVVLSLLKRRKQFKINHKFYSMAINSCAN